MAVTDSAPGHGAGVLAWAVRFSSANDATAVTPRRCGRCDRATPDGELWILMPRVQLVCEHCKEQATTD